MFPGPLLPKNSGKCYAPSLSNAISCNILNIHRVSLLTASFLLFSLTLCLQLVLFRFLGCLCPGFLRHGLWSRVARGLTGVSVILLLLILFGYSRSGWRFFWLSFGGLRAGIRVRIGGVGVFVCFFHFICFSFGRRLLQFLLESNMGFSALFCLLLCSFKIIFIVARLEKC